MSLSPLRRRLGVLFVLPLLALAAPPARAAEPLDLETLTAAQAEKMLEDGSLTSVALTQAYIDRINALNKSGPGLNAVTQFNPDALVEAAAMDRARAEGKDLGPAMGLPILLKDIVDDNKEYTSAGNFSLRNSYPAEDSGVTKNLRAHGVVILGKLGLSEFANHFGNQTSGFSNLTGQVLNALDADATPSGSSSGSGAAGAAALSALTIGTETNGSITSPSNAQGLVGLRPTVGLVPGYGIAPIYASQDTAGPMVRDVTAAAMTLQSIADPDDPKAAAEYTDVFGPGYKADGVIPTAPFTTATVPDYMSALSTDFVAGKRIGYTGTRTDGSLLDAALDALEAKGAVVVAAPAQGNVGTLPSGLGTYEAHKTIDAYYANLGPDAPIKSMDEEVQDNLAHPLEALKYGNSAHASDQQTDISAGGANEVTFRQNIRTRKTAYHGNLDDVFNGADNADPSDDLIAVVGSLSNTPVAGYPQTVIPMGYQAGNRRPQNVSVYGPAYSERDLIGVSYVIEQATKLRQPVSTVNPSQYRCADTTPPSPFAARGHCNPDNASIMDVVGTRPDLSFSLEDESASSLQARETAGTLSAETLTKAYLSRIALANADGPALQAVRQVDAAAAIARAKTLDDERASGDVRGPLHGIPVLVDDSVDAKGFPTTGGSIALQDTTPGKDSKIVSRLRAAGAIVLGKTNVTELNGIFDSAIPEGYSSLGGQVLMPFDTDKTPAGSSGGSAAAASSGFAALTVGLETSTDSAQLVAPAAVAGVVGLKPTVGRVSRAGVLGVAKSQDSPGPIAKTVTDVANALQVMAVRDSADSATNAAPAPGTAGTDYTAGLTTTALQGKRIGVTSSSTVPYPAAVAALAAAGATTVTKTVPAASTQPSVIAREFKRDVNAYLGGTPGGASSLKGIIDYNAANPQEGLKYQQRELVDAQATDISDASSQASADYAMARDTGRTESRAIIDGLLANDTPNDASDDLEAIAVPSGNALVGIADRAGYPVLTVPDGYGATNSGSGHNPFGLVLVGTAYSEARLLADGYAYEQATKLRVAPSLYFPAAWRCVPGSTYYHPYKCHPGDLQYTSVLNAVPTPTPTETVTATPTEAATAAPTGTATAAPTATATATATPGPGTETGLISKVLQKIVLQRELSRRLSATSLKVTDTFLSSGTVRYSVRVKGRTIGTKLVKVVTGTRTTTVRLSAKGRRFLKRHKKAKVTLRTSFDGSITTRTVRRAKK